MSSSELRRRHVASDSPSPVVDVVAGDDEPCSKPTTTTTTTAMTVTKRKRSHCSNNSSCCSPSRAEVWMWRVPVILFYAFWFVFGILVLRKTQNAIAAVRYVKRNSHTVAQEIIENSREFDDLIHILDEEFTRPPAFLLLNQYALNMTYNFLCNTASLPGVHERLIFVTLDTVSRDELRKTWPNIRQFHWPTPSLYVSSAFSLRFALFC